MQVREVMSTDVVYIEGNSTVAEAINLMLESKISSLMIDRRNQNDALGIITKSDIVRKVLAKKQDPKEVKVHEVMSKPVMVVNANWHVLYAAQALAKAKVHVAPCVWKGVEGVISVNDLLKVAIQDEAATV